MTEVRMICVRKGAEPYPVELPNGKKAWYDSRNWVPVEPAPPKDWHPYCFNKNCCTTKHLGILSDMEPCKSCPYRKMEE